MNGFALALCGFNLFACVVNVATYFASGRHWWNAVAAAVSLAVAVFCLVPEKRP